MMSEKVKTGEIEGQKAKYLNSEENKVSFEVWFSMNLNKIPGMEPHHFAALKAFVDHLEYKSLETPEKFESAIIKFGYKPTI